MLRGECYRFHLLGLTQQQIGEALNISHGQVSRYIDDVRNAKVWMNKPAKVRYVFLLQEIYDRTGAWYAEASRLYYETDITPEEKIARGNLIARINSSLVTMTRFIPDAEAMRIEHEMEALKQVHETIGKTIEEIRQKGKIVDLPPYPAWNVLTKN